MVHPQRYFSDEMDTEKRYIESRLRKSPEHAIPRTMKMKRTSVYVQYRYNTKENKADISHKKQRIYSGKGRPGDGLKQGLYICQHTFSQIFFAVHWYSFMACTGLLC